MEIKVIKKVRKTIEEEVSEVINIDFPTEHKFYKMVDEGNFFPRGIVLFAILIKYSNTFLLFEIERGIQNYADFVPTKDCKQESFLDPYEGIRRTALAIMLGNRRDFTEISEEEFIKERDLLLNAHFQERLKKD